MKYYSQFGQDKYLFETYYTIRDKGIFVDIGAHDGIQGSNTLFFEQLGWEGICFEPIPKVFEQLQKNRKCQLNNIAISDKKGETDFFCIDGYSEMLSGMVSDYSPAHIERITREIKEHNQDFNYLTIKTDTFNNVTPFTKIDILSIDTEGSEEKILRSIDYTKFFIKLMCVEFNYKNDSLIEFLDSKGFRVIKQLGVDLIFENNS